MSSQFRTEDRHKSLIAKKSQHFLLLFKYSVKVSIPYNFSFKPKQKCNKTLKTSSKENFLNNKRDRFEPENFMICIFILLMYTEEMKKMLLLSRAVYIINL